MALLASFIGINKHSDLRINELTGATKDATALWALFSDSMPSIHSQRILDEYATTGAIRKAINDTFGTASKEDTVIFFFAGHGTPRHQIVPYDANLDMIDDTTIPMQELSDHLKNTKARASVIILDCCFSGGAPARVIEGIPVSRSAFTQVTDLGGDGRVVLAASRDDQEALELGRHGLFTAALLRVLQEGPNWIDIGVMMEQVSRQVRAEASRTGHTQTPVWAGLIEGGIELPNLRPGPLFVAEFPETTGLCVNKAIADLSTFGLPKPILDAWQNRFNELNNLQLSAINNFRVLDGQSLLVVAPTTSGKTFVGELSAARAIADGRKVVFLLPFKALTNEKYEEFEELYGQQLGFRVLRCTGDYTDQTDPFVKGQYDLALLTYEMFLGLSVAIPTLLSKIGLVVIDEAQFITDSTRGIGVELLLTNLLAARKRGIVLQIVALSAVIGDINSFDSWLGCKALISNERPIPLIEGVIDRYGTFQFLDIDGQSKTMQLLEPHEVVQRRDKPSSQDIIVPLARKFVNDGEQVIVFRNMRGSSSGCARYLSTELGLPPANDVIEQLPNNDLSTTSQALRNALLGGTAFHTSDLSREERLIVERAFRIPGGTVRTIVATSTVAAGINTPAETVIIAETAFPGRPPEDYTVATYKNMAGRAGRLGLAGSGKSILLASDQHKRDLLFNRYVLGEPEPIRSSFDPRDVDTWILRLLAQVKEIPQDTVASLLANTYGGYLQSLTSKSWETQIHIEISDLLQRMLELDLLEEESGFVHLSILGKACGKSHLKLPSAMRLVELIRRSPDGTLSAEKLLALIHALPEFDDAYTPMFRRGQREMIWQDHVARQLGREVAVALQRGAADNFAYNARCKRIAVLGDWINGVSINKIEENYTINPFNRVGAGDIRSFADFARFHLSAAFEIADILLLGQGPSAEDVENLLIQLEVGIPKEAIGLLDLPINLTRGTYLALFHAGAVNPEMVWEFSDEQLRKIIQGPEADMLNAMHPQS